MLLEKLRHVRPLCRYCVAAGVVMVVVGVVVLSAAARRPCRSQSSITWHTTKASRMNESTRPVSARVQETEVRKRPALEPLPPAVWPEEDPPRVLPAAFQVYQFRSPPALA